MVWALKSQPARKPDAQPLLAGLDLNGTRARGVQGTNAVVTRVLPLDGAYLDLPMILSLQGRKPQVGRPGSALCRQSPHLTCSNFLPYLGEQRTWSIGRHQLDAGRAMVHVFERLLPACQTSKGVVLALPAYLSPTQASFLAPLADKARFPLLGSVRAPLALAHSAFAADPWAGPALVFDIDDHALSATTIVADGEHLWVQNTVVWTNVSLRAWQNRLLDGVAERCIHQCRRDPRESPVAEQSLYEQIEAALDAWGHGKVVELHVQTSAWYHNLLFRPEEILALCRRLVQQMLEQVQAQTSIVGVRRILVTRAAARLPGLTTALEEWLQRSAGAVVEATPAASSDDFGEDLIPGGNEPLRLTVLAPDAAARAAHHLALHIQNHALPRGHFDYSLAAPRTPTSAAPTVPPARPSFRILSPDS
ncbi:MAG TPA: hypothetical protein VGP68_01725 [Gemmataceae bacterium]|jgi:hypothetical protein|nr:hypothetical protein [Gemmataceae bacterium]